MASQSQPLVSNANGMGHSRGNASISNSHLEGSEIVHEPEVSHYQPPMDPNHTPDHEQIETIAPAIKISSAPHPTSGRQSQANNDNYDDEWDHSTVRVQALSYSGNKERYSSESSRDREDFEY